jgi:hypothetical protein
MLAVGSLFVGAIANRITPKWALLVNTSPFNYTCVGLTTQTCRLEHLGIHRTLLVCIALTSLAQPGYSFWVCRPRYFRLLPVGGVRCNFAWIHRRI